ncbi:thymosin beta cib isoform X3 [Rhipicephalus microplus]|uniref:thymosin beta cib isoform X3 n=1 Tax=Rhipicephalus microplus TaxID=6941 RepID=UPI003F6A7A46
MTHRTRRPQALLRNCSRTRTGARRAPLLSNPISLRLRTLWIPSALSAADDDPPQFGVFGSTGVNVASSGAVVREVKEKPRSSSRSSESSGQNPRVADEIQQELASFNASSLKHTETQEKVLLPSKEDIESEKEHKQMIEGIETFDPSKLKHAETSVKNPLPTKEVIEQEKAA